MVWKYTEGLDVFSSRVETQRSGLGACQDSVVRYRDATVLLAHRRGRARAHPPSVCGVGLWFDLIVVWFGMIWDDMVPVILWLSGTW